MTDARVDLLRTAAESGDYSIFLNGVAAAGLSDILTGEGPFTLFAPLDEAFAALPQDAWEKLLAPDQKSMLKAALSYHFAPGTVRTRQFAGKTIRATAFDGRTLRIDGKDGIRVNSARVVRPDIEASNGVLHGIDAFLWPELIDQPRATAGV